MDSFYDMSYGMVTYDDRNAAVDQLAVNTTGDVTVEGGLNVNGNVFVSKQLHITSDGNTSNICMHGSGNPDITHPSMWIFLFRVELLEVQIPVI